MTWLLHLALRGLRWHAGLVMVYDAVWRERYDYEIKRFGHSSVFSPERDRYRERVQALLSSVGRACSRRAQSKRREKPKLNPGKSDPLVNLLARMQLFVGLILLGI